jgi:Holliday junction resolvase YEN1
LRLSSHSCSLLTAHQGVDCFGKTVAHGLAQCGFGDQLLTAYERRNHQDLHLFLHQWRTAINHELHTNTHGFLPHKTPSLSLPHDFPNIKILANYASLISWRGA